jgi:hypothetical protein
MVEMTPNDTRADGDVAPRRVWEKPRVSCLGSLKDIVLAGTKEGSFVDPDPSGDPSSPQP